MWTSSTITFRIGLWRKVFWSMAFSFIQKWADIQYLSSRKFVRWNLELHQGSEAPCKVIIILWIKLNDYSSTTNLCPFIQGSLEWPFSELFSANVSVWNQYKYIAFNIFSCRILIISFKMLHEYLTKNKSCMEYYIETSQYFIDKNK